MSDIAFVNKDIMASSFGDILIVNDDEDVIQMAINNILMIHGANEFHPEMGNMVYHNRYKMTERGLQEIASQCKSAIMQDPRVSEVIEIVARNASTPTNIGLCDVSFMILTTYGAQLSSGVSITL